jgi:pimeloyl-ACP methyl ester carboxylesterase
VVYETPSNLKFESETPVTIPEENQNPTSSSEEQEKIEWNDEYQICVFDNRGVGISDCPGGKYSTAIFANDAFDIIEHLGWESVHIVGLSMGMLLIDH